MTKTKCTNCGYEAITWHKDLKHLNNCRKCNGKLEILALEVK